jgi:very-short-patch-repair endonuclease
MSLAKNPELLQVINAQTKKLRKKSTIAERILWEELRNRKFLNKKFYRQYAIIHDILGRETFFIADFYSYAERLVIELDGDIHNYRLKRDKQKEDVLKSLGLRIIRFNNSEVEKDVLERLKKFICSKKCYYK